MFETLELMYNTDPMGFLKLFYYFILKASMFSLAGYYLFCKTEGTGFNALFKAFVLIALAHLLPWG